MNQASRRGSNQARIPPTLPVEKITNLPRLMIHIKLVDSC